MTGWLVRQVIAAVLVAVMISTVGVTSLAQEVATHPARLRVGTCDEVRDRAYELNPVSAGSLAAVSPDSPDLVLAPMGPEGSPVVAQSRTEVDAPLSDLVDQGLVLIVAESEAQPGQAIACGEVGGLVSLQMAGMVMPGDELAIGLREQNDSGFAGIAVFTADGLSTWIHIYLAHGLFGSDSGEDAPPDD